MKFTYPDELMFLKNSKAKQQHSELSLKGKVVVLTGATSGIGLATAHRFAQDKAHLILVIRNKQKGTKLKEELINQYNIHVDIVLADFLNFESIQAAAQEILSLTQTIDVLISNAGIHSTKLVVGASGFDNVLTVNHLSSFLFTHLLYPALVKKQGRVIYVNSEGHRFASFKSDDLLWKKRHYTGLRSYGASKTAQLLCVLEMAKQAESDNVTIIAMHPGDVKSNIGKNNGWLYRTFSKYAIQPFLKNVEVASNALHYLSVDPSITRNSGKFYHLTLLENPAKHASNATLAKEVYQKSCLWVNLSSNQLKKTQ